MWSYKNNKEIKKNSILILKSQKKISNLRMCKKTLEVEVFLQLIFVFRR
jgi:hypothetical protein